MSTSKTSQEAPAAAEMPTLYKDATSIPSEQVRKGYIGVFLLCISALFISDDVFLVFEVGSAHVRVVQLILIGAVAAVAVRSLYRPVKDLVLPIGSGLLLLWSLLLSVFAWNVPVWGLQRTFGYVAWLLLDILTIFALCNCTESETQYRLLLRWYLLGMGMVSVFGIYQFTAPIVGLTPPLVQQWLFPEQWARASGFSYEPSYFSTYLISGWVTLDYLSLKQIDVFRVSTRRVLFLVVSVALILSTSRIGWLGMLLWWCLRTAWRLTSVREFLRTIGKLLASCAVIAVVLFVASAWDFDLIPRLASGVIITETADAYSVDQRLESLQDTLQVFRENPWIGVSLGGRRYPYCDGPARRLSDWWNEL